MHYVHKIVDPVCATINGWNSVWRYIVKWQYY